MVKINFNPCALRWGSDMDAVTVTVIKGGWWLPGRALAEGQTLALDAATAEALSRRGIVRLEMPAPMPAPDVAPNAGAPEPKPARRKPSSKEA